MLPPLLIPFANIFNRLKLRSPFPLVVTNLVRNYRDFNLNSQRDFADLVFTDNKDEIDNKQNKTLLPACADGNITIKEVNWTSCSMDTLIQHCKERRLSYTGRSSDLVERLIRFEVTNLLTTVDAKKYDPFIDPSGVIWLKELTVVRTKILELLDKVEAAVKKYVKKRLTYISSRFENRLTQAFRKYQNDVAILNLSEVLCSQELMQKADSAEAKYNNDKAELDAMNPAIESYVTAEKGVNKTWYDGKKNIVSNSMTRTSEEINSVGKLKANKDVTTIKGLEVHQSATVRANSAAKREEKKNKKVITAGTYQVSLGELSGSRKVCCFWFILHILYFILTNDLIRLQTTRLALVLLRYSVHSRRTY